MKSRDPEIAGISAQARKQKKIGLPSLLPKLGVERTEKICVGSGTQSVIRTGSGSGFQLCSKETAEL